MSLKKLLLALPMLMTGFAIDATAATYDCWRTKISASLFKDRDTSESYLYAEESHKGNGGDYYGFVCGHEGTKGCPAGALVLMPKGHMLANVKKNAPAAYMCNTSGYNTWNERDMASVIDDCKSGEVKKFKLFGNQKIGDYYYMCEFYGYNSCYHGRKCKATEAQYQCEKDSNSTGYDFSRSVCNCKTGYDWKNNKCEKDINNLSDQQKCASIGGNWYNGVCKCDDRDYFDPDVKQCLPKSQCNKSAVVCANNVINLSDFGNSTTTVNGGNASVSNSGNSSNTNNNENNNNSKNTNGNNAGGKSGGGSGSGGSACLNRPTAEGRACCRAGGATTFKNNVCTCVDTTKEWKYTDGAEYGQCVAKGSTEVVNPCDAICTNYVSIVVDNCAMQKVNNYANVITQITQQCSNRTNCNPGTVGQLVNQIEVAVASCANQPVEPEKPQLNEQRLAAAVEAIDKYRSGLDVSVWKDAEGNFNTARLVSDSIAGVVLGTAGGLITSSVVKKNQVKNGFEDVVCTIGGQTVGSYGDEISVGIK